MQRDREHSKCRSEHVAEPKTLHLPSTMEQESYTELNKKSLSFFSHVARLYNADFVVKVDDDAFLRLDRLMHALTQWKELGAGEIMSDSAP